MKLTYKVVRRSVQGALDSQKLAQEFAAVRASYVKAGVLASEHKSQKRPDGSNLTNAELASINEFGLGNAPPRPFIGPPFRLNRKKYMKRLITAYKAALKAGRPSKVTTELGRLGLMMEADIKNYVTQGPGVPPPNAPSTIARKGSSRTLVDSSEMINSVTSKVVSGKRR